MAYICLGAPRDGTSASTVLDRLLAGTPLGCIAGADAMKFAGWQRLVAEYAKQFGVETPNWPLRARPE